MESVPTVIYVWRKAGDLLKGKYIKHLEDKEGFSTFRNAIEFLEKENAKYFNYNLTVRSFTASSDNYA